MLVEDELRKLEPTIVAVAYSMAEGDKFLQDDLAQEMRFRVWESQANKPKCYYARICRHVGLDYLKSKKHRYTTLNCRFISYESFTRTHDFSCLESASWQRRKRG